MYDRITVRGARVHNLKNVTVTIPRDKLVVFTGLSGSGKSSLAFDTIYSEGQRRYVESLSSYARQFLGQMDKPDVDSIDGLSPSISIDQKSTSRNPRSTVGTVTEIHDYLRLLYARTGIPHCPRCGRAVARQSASSIVDAIMAYPAATRILVMAPIVRGRKGEYHHLFDELRREGYVRVRVDGVVRALDEDIDLDRQKKHDIAVVVDRLIVRAPVSREEGDSIEPEEDTDDGRARIADSVETALKKADGLALVQVLDGPETMFSEHFACPACGISLPEIEPRIFSFNSPHGACPTCTGLGYALEVDPERVLPNPHLSIERGAVIVWSVGGETQARHSEILRRLGIPTDVPIGDLTPDQRRILLEGVSGAEARAFWERGAYPWRGVLRSLREQLRAAHTEEELAEIEPLCSLCPCVDCQGERLKPESLAVTVGDLSIAAVSHLSVADAARWFAALAGDEKVLAARAAARRAHRPVGLSLPDPLPARAAKIGNQILKEIRARLGFLVDVGLGYLALDRSATTLSGGEAQRIRLASQIGSGLVGVLYVLDEPSIGLHQRDNARLIVTLLHLRDLGNTLIVVEHDEETMRAADHIVDVGPGAGEHGGCIVAEGTLDAIMATPESITGDYLSGRKEIPLPPIRRRGSGRSVTIRGATANNLDNVDVAFSLATLTCVTGVSGSGKSTLVNDILYRASAQRLMRARTRPAAHASVEGLEALDKVIDIDQSPIGRTPRSNPATYTDLFTPIRDIFSKVPEARIRGSLSLHIS